METPGTKTSGKAKHKTTVSWSVARLEITSKLQWQFLET